MLAVSGVALAQVEPWALEIQRLHEVGELCALRHDRTVGDCDVDGSVRAGAWTASVVHAHEHGRYLGAPTMRWHLAFTRGARRFGTRFPIYQESTICTGDSTARLGGYDAFVLEEITARNVVGDAAIPEVVVRYRESAGRPVGLYVCSVEGRAPRCSGPYTDGPITAGTVDFQIGAVRVAAP